MNKRIRNKKAKLEPAKPTVKTALAEVETSATHLAEAVKAEAKTRADDALGQLKENLHRVEEKAEALLEKIPGVGPTAARKLRGAIEPAPSQERAPRKRASSKQVPRASH